MGVLDHLGWRCLRYHYLPCLLHHTPRQMCPENWPDMAVYNLLWGLYASTISQLTNNRDLRFNFGSLHSGNSCVARLQFAAGTEAQGRSLSCVLDRAVVSYCVSLPPPIYLPCTDSPPRACGCSTAGLAVRYTWSQADGTWSIVYVFG